jgi:NADPH-dependent 2,4-dienoyl-CoA reductase/sulfur reductase-like enzyme/nitrite reductase/ring-hydroxylating ferredoxin subunit
MADSTPDFAAGVPAHSLSHKPLAGQVDGKAVILVRAGGRICAVSGECTHLGAPLETGLVVGTEIRCPWHHARFSLETGEALGAPAIEPLSCYTIEERDGTVRVADRTYLKPSRVAAMDGGAIVIIGGGAAGYACADMLARAGQGDRVTILSADADPPYDRTFCSKHYLTGEKSRAECMMPTAGLGLGHPPRVRTGVEVSSIDVAIREVVTVDGERIGYSALVLATGAEPMVPVFNGSDHEGVYQLRTLADADALIEAAKTAKTVAILGAGFIGLEVAASLRARDLDVTVVGAEQVPLASVLGEEAGRFVQSLHEAKAVRFRLDRKVVGYDGTSVTLDDGDMVQADMLIVGAGVKPRIALAKEAGLILASDEDGIAVDGRFATSAEGVFAIGDVASYPDPRLNHSIRVEHWAHAQRQGQHLARVLLGNTEAAFRDVPFFWSTHHDIGIHYIGHVATPKVRRIEGAIEDGEFAIFLREGGEDRALVTLERDLQSLEVEAAWEQGPR